MSVVFGAGPQIEWQFAKHVSSAFDGGTLNAHGDQSGTGNPYTIFNVTGVVILKAMVGICNTTLTSGGAPTLSVGTTNNTSIIISPTTALDIDQNDVWNSDTPDPEIDMPSLTAIWTITPLNNADIIETIGVADITAGQIDYYCIWAPVDAGSLLVPA